MRIGNGGDGGSEAETFEGNDGVGVVRGGDGFGQVGRERSCEHCMQEETRFVEVERDLTKVFGAVSIHDRYVEFCGGETVGNRG